MSATRKFRTDLTAANRGALRSATALGRVLSVAAAATALGAEGVEAGPKGGVVKAGSATITTRGGTTTINQAGQKVVIDWDSFDIDAKDAVNFLQPGKDSIALNRVLNDLPTNIRGRLTANGNVWIVNQHGVTFHAGAMVNVGSLIATTADIDNADFMAGNYKFDKPGDPNARIINEGDITFGEAGLAAFVAPSAANRGVIAGRMGKVVIAGNETFAVDLAGDGMWAFTMGEGANGASAANSGRIHNPGGYILISARAAQGMVDSNISVGGVVEATTARVEGGKIVLSGDGFVEVSGALDATGAEAGQVGGSIEVTGDKVHVTATAKIDASGDAGGGSVKIGGDYQGGGALKTASRTLISEGAEIAASAIGQVGDGGEVIVWADEITGFFGSIRATGGANAGDGGFAEVSGKQQLAFDGMVDLSARNGLPGELLLDPEDIIITLAAGADDGELADGEILAGDSPGATFTLSATAIETALQTSSVSITANNSITQNADAPIDFSGEANNLSLSTDTGVILLQSTIDAGAGGLTLNAGGALTVDGVITSIGALDFDAGSLIALNSAISSTAGNVSLTANTAPTGTVTFGATVDGGDIDVTTMGAVALGDVGATGSLTVNSGGAITEAAGAAINVTGATSLTSMSTIDLSTQNTHTFGGTVTLSGTQIVDFAVLGGATFGDITATNGADVENRLTVGAGSLALNGTISIAGTSDLYLNSGGLVSSSGAITADQLRFAGGSFLLSGANDVASLATPSGSATVVSFNDINGVDLAGLNLIALTVTAGGAITDSATNSVLGAASLTATGADITLDEAANGFGALSLTGASANVLNLADLRLGDVDLSGAFVVDVTGGVIQGATTIAVDGTTSITAADDIALASALNDFSGAVTLSGEDISIANAATVTLNVGAVTAANNSPADTTLGGDGDVTVAGGAIAFGGALTGVDDLTVNATGAVSQTAALSLNGALDVNAAGQNVTLSNASNDFNDVDVTGAVVSLGDADAIALGAITADDLTVNAGGAITEATGAVIDVGGPASLTTTGDIDIRLPNTHTFDGAVTLSAARIVDFATYTGVTFGAVTATNGADAENRLTSGSGVMALNGAVNIAGTSDLYLSSGGAITQTGAITADQLRLSGAALMTLSGDNDVNSLATPGAAIGALVFNDTDGVDLAGVSASTVTITANGAVSDSAANTITSATSITATGSSIALDETGNTFGTLGLVGSEATVQNVADLELGDVNVATLTVNAAGAVTQAGATSLTVTASTSITATEDILLANAANAIAGDVTLSGEDINLDAGGDITLGALAASSAASDTLIAGAGDVTISGGAVAFSASPTGVNDLDVIAAGDISQTAPISITGDADLSAPMNAINLANGANDFQGRVDAAASSVTLYDANDLQLGLINADTLIANAGGDITLTTIDANAISVETTNGAITQTGGTITTAAGTAVSDFTATTGVTLDQAGNNFGGPTGLTGQTVTIRDTDALVLDDVTATGALVVNAGGAVSQNAASSVTVTETATVTATGQTINLGNDNDFRSTFVATGADVTVSDTDAIELGAIAASTLTVEAGGAVSQSAGATVANETTVTAAGQAVDLNNAANAFTGVVNVTGGAVEIDNTIALGLGDITVTTLDAVAATGNVTNAADDVLSVTGTATITSTAGSVTIASNAMNAEDLRQTVTLSAAGDISLTGVNAQKLVLGDVTSTTGTVTVDVAEAIDLTGNVSASAGGDAVTLRSAGDITQIAGAISAAELTIASGGNAVSLTTATNAVDTLTLGVNGAVNVVEVGGLAIGQEGGGGQGALTVRSTGAITQASSLTVTNNADFVTEGASITLNAVGNAFGSVSADTTYNMAAANAVTINEADATVISAIAATSATVTSGGAISQTGVIDASANSSFTAGGDIDLTDLANDFADTGSGSTAAFSGVTVNVTDADTLALGAVTSSASTTITADDAGASGSFSGGLTELRFFDTDGDMVLASTLVLPATVVNFTADSVGAIDAQSLTLTNAATLLDAATSVTFSTGAGTFASLMVNAPGGVSQTAPITVTGATDLNAPTSQIALGNALNDFQGRVDADASRVTIFDAFDLELALINSDTLVANAGRDITDQGARIEARNYAGLTAGDDILIDTLDTHVFGDVSLSADQITHFAASGSIGLGPVTATNMTDVVNRITVTGGVTLDGAISTAGLSDLTFETTDGNILQQSGALTTDALTLDLGTGDGTLVVGANDINTLAASAGDVSLTDTDGVTIATVSASTLTVMAGATIDQQAMSTVTLSGLADLTATGANITLNEATNDFSAIDAEGADLTFSDANGVELTDIDASGALSVTALGGDITDGDAVATPAGSDVNVAGTTTLTASGAITLDDASHDFGGAVAADGQAITLRDANSIILGDIDASGALRVEAVAGAITQDGDSAVGGDINAAAEATFTASTTITLTDASNDFEAAVNADGVDVALVDLNAIELADIDAATLSVTAASIDDGAAGAPGDDINVLGETMLAASAAITLDDAANDFGGAISASGTAITLRDANSIVLADIDAGGVLTVDAVAGAISQDGDGAPGADINAAAEAAFTAATTITLTDASNDFAAAVNADGSTVSINDLNALELGDIDATTLAVTAGTTIDDGAASMGANADIDVTGTTTLTALGAITLDDAGNDFGQAVSADGGAVALRDAGNIILGEIAAGGGLTVTAAGAITDSADSSVTVTGATTLTASNNGAYFDIALDNDTATGRHDFGGAVNAIGQDITLIDRNGVTLGAIATNGGAPDDTINVDGGAEATDPGELIVIARGGAITQDAGSVLTVTGDATLEAADGAGGYFDITLTNTQNAFDSDNADAVGDGDTATDSVTFLGETVAITNSGPLLVTDSVANTGGALTAQTGDLTVERLRVNAANGPLIGIAQDGAIDADDLSGGSITLGGAGSADGAATAASGVVTVDNFAVGALAVASDISTTLTNGDAGGGLRVAAPLQTFTFVTADAFTDGAATDFNALTGSTADQLILERIAFDSDITIAAGDVDLGHIDAADGFFVTALTGDVSKRPDAEIDFGGSAATGFTVAGARGAADQAVTLQSFDSLLRVGGAASFTATSGDVVITRGGAKQVDLQGQVSIAATDAAIEDQSSLILGQVAVGGDFAIRISADNANAAAEALTQTASQTITVGGDLALITGVGDTARSDVTLASAGNSFNTVSALAGDLSIRGADAFTLQNSDLTGGLTIGSAAARHVGDLTVQDVRLGGDLAFDATGAATLNRLDVAAVTGQAGAGLTAANLSAADAVSLTTTGGGITVTDAITGAFDFDSAGALTVTNLAAAGSANGASTAAGDITIANIILDTNASFDSTGGALDIDSARIGSTLTLSASGDITLGAIATGADLSATSDAASVLIRNGATEAPAAFTVIGVQAADIGFASGPLVGDLADNRVIDTAAGTADQTVDPADFALQLAIGGDAAFNAAGSVLLPREAAAEGGLQNDFMGDVAISAAGGDVVIEDANALSFATVTITAGDLFARSNADNSGAGEGITQTAAIAVGGTASFVTGDHGGAAIADEAFLADVVLGSEMNDFTGAVTVIADNAALVDANAITVANSQVANALIVDATSAGAGDVAAVTDTQSGGATTVTSGGGVDLDQVIVGGALTATAQGVDLTANDLAVTGAATLTAATTIAVDDALLADATITAGASGALSDVSAQVINVETGGVTITGLSAAAATVASTGAGDAVLSDLSVTGATEVTAGGAVSLDQISLAATTVTAGGDLSLTNGQTAAATLNSGGALTASNLRTGALEAATTGDVTLDAMQVAGDAAILSTDGDIALGSVAVAGQLTAESGAGAIRTIDSDFALGPVTVIGGGAGTAAAAPTLIGEETNTNLLVVGGDAYFMAAGDIALVDDEVGVTGDNDFMGGVTAISDGSIILNDANDLVIGAPTGVARPGGRRFLTTGLIAANSLRIEAGGSITDADAPQATVEVGGDARLLAGGDILLDNETHAIGGAVAARGQNITLTEVGSITLGPINASGDLMVEAGANNAAPGGTLGDAAILQGRAVTVANADIGAEAEDETIRGAIQVDGAATFTTGLDPRFAIGNPQLTGRRDLVLDSRANDFGGRLNIARIAGDATITENSLDDAAPGEQGIGNFEIGGTTRLTTTDNIVFIGRMTALTDDVEPENPLPERPEDVAARGQGTLGLADEDLRLFIATGESLIIDTTGGQNAQGAAVRPAGANVRFDGAVDGDNDALPLGGPTIASDREGLGGLTINAGANGEIRFRDFVGASHPLGDVTLSAGDIFAGFTFETAQPDLETANFTRDNRFLFDRLNQDDFFFARDLKVNAARRIEFLTPFRTVENFILLDQYFGVNIASLVFGGLEGAAAPVGPEIVQSFGFIGNDRSRATGLFPRGPQGGNFQFNDCIIGDVADCTNIPIPNVVNNILTPAPPLLGIDTEDLLELFGSFGNEELWGVPQSYYSDLGVEPESRPDCAKDSDNTDCGES